jgi:ElaB/YqjD/DUF883 family membrane-anchored ribosome-binding protein
MFPASTKENVANDVKLGANRVKEEVRHTAANVGDDLEYAANTAGRKVRQYFDTASDEISHAAEAVTTQIRSKPLQSSLVALAAGFVLGALFRR